MSTMLEGVQGGSLKPAGGTAKAPDGEVREGSGETGKFGGELVNGGYNEQDKIADAGAYKGRVVPFWSRPFRGEGKGSPGLSGEDEKKPPQEEEPEGEEIAPLGLNMQSSPQYESFC